MEKRTQSGEKPNKCDQCIFSGLQFFTADSDQSALFFLLLKSHFSNRIELIKRNNVLDILIMPMTMVCV